MLTLYKEQVSRKMLDEPAAADIERPVSAFTADCAGDAATRG